MNRFDFIKTRSAKRRKNNDAVEKIRTELEKEATNMVNRIVKTMDPETAGQMTVARKVMEKRKNILEKLADADRDPVGPILLKPSYPEDIKKRKLMKIDRFQLKQKVAKLQSHINALDENDEGTLWVKETLRNIIVTRIKEFDDPLNAKAAQQKLHQKLTTDEFAYLACILNDNPPIKARTVGQLFTLANKMGITVKMELIKSPFPLIDAVGRGDTHCHYIDGVMG